MPFRKDHLQLVTDAGATLDIGWDYGTPYSLDPINGVDVNLQKAQGSEPDRRNGGAPERGRGEP